ncbi:MAG: hypothetical protein ACRD6X_21645, partial [Pyrinomonadaceae bacterium]
YLPEELEQYQQDPGFRFEDRGLGMYTATNTTFSHYSVRDRWGIDDIYNGTSWSGAVDAAMGAEHFTVIRNWNVSTSSFTFNWSLIPQPQQQTKPAEHAQRDKATQKGPKTLKNLTKALEECTRDLFQVKVTSFTPSERGKAGNVNFNFTDPNRRLNGYMGFGVMNDVTSYSIVTAPEDVKIQAGKNQRITGFTNSGSPHINYTLSNITNWLDIVKTQIHELGHSLQYITRNAVGGFPQYDEAGWKLENCVRDKGGFK